MKILRIRLHPFGGSVDRSMELHDGLNIVDGPNEYGKSTLSQALWHALFTPSNLTPAKLRDAMQPWFPKPSGDHARVTLEFEADGRQWTLLKCWGAGASSLLQADGSESMADPTGIQKRLSVLLHRNEATWRHVLFLKQGKLNRTLEELRENSDIDDIQPLLVGAAAIPGDIPEEKLAEALDTRIGNHFSRWDRVTRGPENGRGIENPWANRIGPLLSAYYTLETTRRELDEVLDYEKKVDQFNTRAREEEASGKAVQEFVEIGRLLKGGLAKREGLEERIKRLADELSTLRKVFMEWPGADNVLAATQQSIVELTETLKSLDTELANALKRASAEDLRLQHEHLVKARSEWNAAAQSLRESKTIPPGMLEQLESLTNETEKLRIQIAAQKLTARMSSQSDLSIAVTRGAGNAETVELASGLGWTGEAEGKLKLETGNLSIEVAVGTGEVDSLFSKLQKLGARQNEILAESGFADLASVKAADMINRECIHAGKNKKAIYEAALLGKTEETWAAEISALAALPATRSLETVENERNKAVTGKAQQEARVHQLLQKVEKWKQDYETVDLLTSRILEKTQELKSAESELAGLPQLPGGFANVSNYLTELGEKEQQLTNSGEIIKNLKLELAKLSGSPPKRTAEDLRDELERKERELQRCEETGQSLLRIRSKLNEIRGQRGIANPMQGLEAAIAGYFQRMTCGNYERVRLDGGTPVEVTGKLTLKPGSLSQGTLGSLAMATRLALAELYLGELPGFLVLDDPFTDMDPARRSAAGQCLGAFAAKHQVIFFTCHKDHAGELETHAGARSVQMKS